MGGRQREKASPPVRWGPVTIPSLFLHPVGVWSMHAQTPTARAELGCENHTWSDGICFPEPRGMGRPPADHFMGTNKLILKFTWKSKRSRTGDTVQKNKVRVGTIPLQDTLYSPCAKAACVVGTDTGPWNRNRPTGPGGWIPHSTQPPDLVA